MCCDRIGKGKTLEIVQDIGKLDIEGRSAIAIGKFDGIHIGHQALLAKILEKKKEGMFAVIFTFTPSPEEFFKGTMLPSLDTQEEKRKQFEAMGVDILIEYPLTKESAAVSPEEFMQSILWDKLHAGYVVSGSDLSFGDKGRGNATMLSSFAKEHSFLYEEIDKIRMNGIEVSSTSAKNALEEGNVELANRMLGRSYTIRGEVVHGRALGRTVDMPTINVMPHPQKFLPRNGVYATMTGVDGQFYPGVTNIGCKPTVSKENTVSVETHLLDFHKDIYGKKVVTWLLHYIRPEECFDNLESLVKQVKNDEMSCRAYLGEIKPNITNIM